LPIAARGNGQIYFLEVFGGSSRTNDQETSPKVFGVVVIDKSSLASLPRDREAASRLHLVESFASFPFGQTTGANRSLRFSVRTLRNTIKRSLRPRHKRRLFLCSSPFSIVPHKPIKRRTEFTSSVAEVAIRFAGNPRLSQIAHRVASGR
jgi:hypothetical protein